MCKYPWNSSPCSFPVAGRCLGRNCHKVLWSALPPPWRPGPGPPSCTVAPRPRREGVRLRADPGASRRAWPALAPCSPVGLSHGQARPLPLAVRGRSRPSLAASFARGPRPAGGSQARGGARRRARQLPPAPALARLSGNPIQPAPGCAPRSVSCPTDLGLPGSSLPAGAQNGALASSFPFGYHPPSLKRITTTRMTLSPPWPEDQTSCRRQVARPSSPVLCPLSALPEWGRERRGWVASRITALHGRSLCVGPPWSGSTWDRPARPGGGAAWPSMLLVTPWA